MGVLFVVSWFVKLGSVWDDLFVFNMVLNKEYFYYEIWIVIKKLMWQTLGVLNYALGAHQWWPCLCDTHKYNIVWLTMTSDSLFWIWLLIYWKFIMTKPKGLTYASGAHQWFNLPTYMHRGNIVWFHGLTLFLTFYDCFVFLGNIWPFLYFWNVFIFLVFLWYYPWIPCVRSFWNPRSRIAPRLKED